jgi:integrase
MGAGVAWSEACLAAILDKAEMEERSRTRAVVVVRRLMSFASAQGIAPVPGQLLDHDVIEAFCVLGCAGRSSSTRGTYRSVLDTLAAAGHGPPPRRGTPFAGARAPLPYTPAERAELIAMCTAQRKKATRRSTLSMLWCGLGAGLRPGELVALRGSDISPAGSSVVVHVTGPRRRVVPVAERHAAAIVALARHAGDDVVFRPGGARRHYKNFVNDFARHLVADPAAPRLSMGRCRASFICDHLAAGTPLNELVTVAGLCEVESLARYARHVEGVAHSKAALRARASEERR